MTPRVRLALALGVAIPLLIIVGLRIQGQHEYNEVFCRGTPEECTKAFAVVAAWLVTPTLLFVAVLVAAVYRSWGRVLLLFAAAEGVGLLVARFVPEDMPERWQLLLAIPSPWPFLAASVAVALYAARRLDATPRSLTHVAGAAGLLAALSVLATVGMWIITGSASPTPPELRGIQQSFFGDLLFALVMYAAIPLAAWWPMPPSGSSRF